MPPVGGIPFDCLDPALDIPSEFSRRASIFNHSLGVPDSGARDRLSNPFGGPACDFSRLLLVPSLAYKGKKRPWQFAFLPVGRVFSGGCRCDTVSARNPKRPVCEKEERTLGGAFLGVRVTVFIGFVRWWVAAYKYPADLLAFFIPPSALLPLLSRLGSLVISRARAPSISSESALLPSKMPVRLVATDEWRPSSMTER